MTYKDIFMLRLLTYAEVDISPGSWKRITLGAILLASKVGSLKSHHFFSIVLLLIACKVNKQFELSVNCYQLLNSC